MYSVPFPVPCPVLVPVPVLRAHDVDPSLTRGVWGIEQHGMEYRLWTSEFNSLFGPWCGEANGVTTLALPVLLSVPCSRMVE